MTKPVQFSWRVTAQSVPGGTESIRSVERRTLVGFIATLILLLLTGGFSYRATLEASDSSGWVSHTQQVRASLGRLYGAILDAESLQRRYLLSAEADDLAAYGRYADEAVRQAQALTALVSDNPIQATRIRQLESAVAEHLAILRRTTTNFQTSGLARAQELIRLGEGHQVMESIRGLVRRIDSAEAALLTARVARASAGGVRTLISLLVTLGVASAGFFLLFGSIRRELRTRSKLERAAHNALQESEARYRALFDSIDEGFCIIQMLFDEQDKPVDYRFLQVNRSFEKHTGLVDAVGKRMKEIAPLHEAHWFEIYGRIAMTGESSRFQNRAEQLGRSYDVYAFRFGDPQERQVAILFSDITLRKEAEDALRASEENLEVTLRSIGDGVLATDADGRVVRLNPVGEQLTGWPEGTAIGRPAEEVFHIISEVTRQPAAVPVAETLSKGTIHGLANHTVLIARDGVERPIADSCAPIRSREGRVVGAVLVFRDVTMERAAENELRRGRAVFENLFTSLPGHFLVLDPTFKIVAVSDAYLKATMTDRDAITGRDIFEVFPDNPNDPAATGAANLRASLERVRLNAISDTMAIQKYDIRRPDGLFEVRFWSPINSPVMGADRQVEYIIHRVEDVTDFVRKKSQPTGDTTQLRIRMERMEAEVFQSAQKVQAAKEQLEAANKELEAFSYSVSHDLRAPLRHIHGYVQMLHKATEGQLTPKAGRYLRIITEASVEMGQLIDDLLAFSRMGRAEMREHTMDLNVVVQDTVRGLEMVTRDRPIIWRISRLPPALGDSAMMRQVFSNLIGNAVKYTRGRDPAEIEIGCTGEEDGRIILYVRDNGAGFDMQYAHKLFGVFQRLHRSEEFEGTGIGLATVQRILSRHGGRIWAKAAPNQGATFSFTLRSAPST